MAKQQPVSDQTQAQTQAQTDLAQQLADTEHRVADQRAISEKAGNEADEKTAALRVALAQLRAESGDDATNVSNGYTNGSFSGIGAQLTDSPQKSVRAGSNTIENTIENEKNKNRSGNGNATARPNGSNGYPNGSRSKSSDSNAARASAQGLAVNAVEAAGRRLRELEAEVGRLRSKVRSLEVAAVNDGATHRVTVEVAEALKTKVAKMEEVAAEVASAHATVMAAAELEEHSLRSKVDSLEAEAVEAAEAHQKALLAAEEAARTTVERADAEAAAMLVAAGADAEAAATAESVLGETREVS